MPDENASREELEKEKLDLEIEQLKKSWWKNPEYIKIVPPLIVAIATASLACATWEGDLLNIRIAKFESERQSIRDTIKSLEVERDSLGKATKYFSIQKDLLIASLNEKRDSIKIVESQVERSENNLESVERKNRAAQLELSYLNDSIEKVVGPIKDLLDTPYENYVLIHWRDQMVDNDSFKVYVIDENWNPVPRASIRILGALPDSANNKGEIGFKVSETEYKVVDLSISKNDPVPQEIPMLIGPSLRYRVLLKRRYRGSD